MVFHDLATDIEEGDVGLAVENRQLQHHVRHQQGAAEVTDQHHRPQPQQTAEVGQGRLRHHRQHGGQGVFGEQLLTREDHREETGAITETGDHLESLAVRQTRIEQAHAHQRQAHGQPRRQRRPPQSGNAALELLIALGADDLVQHGGTGRLALFDIVLFLRRKVRGLAVLCRVHDVRNQWRAI
ncbi:hypothetical protein D3C75_726320 [compost metagenome]